METIKELEEERKYLIDKLHSIEKFIKENTNRDERGIFPKDTGKLLVNELNLLLARANTINDYLGLIDRQLELLYLKEKINK
jgi:IS30 family transposase